MKVAAVQYEPAFKQWSQNLQTAVALTKQAALAGAELVVLPELCLSGYSFQSAEEALPFAEVLTDMKGSMAVLGGIANDLDVAVCWGLVRRDPGTGDLYNSQVLMLPGLTWRFYDKVNRWGNDFIWAAPGNQSPPVAQWKGKKVGMLICHDVKNKSSGWDDFYEPGDADIVCFSTAWGDGGFPAERWVHFAMDQKVYFVVANRYGQERNNNFGEGGSCVITPSGKVHCEGLKWNEPCIIYAECG